MQIVKAWGWLIALGAATDPEVAPMTVIDDYQFGFAKRSVQFA